MKTEDKTEKVYNSEFKEKTHSLIEKIYTVIDGNDIFLIISALMIAVEEAISQIDDKDIRNRVVDEAIKQLDEER
jgi:transketolase C-terminal domain/subunit